MAHDQLLLNAALYVANGLPFLLGWMSERSLAARRAREKPQPSS
ncbi:MAG: hypothetical protein WC817_04650 [Patescibacteria group bacterium]